MVMLSRQDQTRIADAVTAAEAATSGEITCVLAQEVSNYREVPLAWAALAALGLPPLLVLAGVERLALADIFTSWTDDSLRAVEGLILSVLSAYALLQAVIFLAVALLLSLPRLRRLVTPGALKRHRVRAVARHHYAASGYRLEPGVPHILIFASLQDRRVELVAHQAIHAQIGQGLWDEAVAAVTEGMKTGREADGFVRAIALCGAAMAKHFPATGPKPNRLSNDIVQT
jgi:putative membrane protein